MNTNNLSIYPNDMRVRLQSLWIFVIFNYLYCDLLSNMDASVLKGLLNGQIAGFQFNQQFMLNSALLMEIPIAMVLLSRLLNYRSNRWANIIAGSIMTIVQIGSLFFGTAPTLHYIFYTVIEAGCTAVIVWLAFRWHAEEDRHN